MYYFVPLSFVPRGPICVTERRRHRAQRPVCVRWGLPVCASAPERDDVFIGAASAGGGSPRCGVRTKCAPKDGRSLPGPAFESQRTGWQLACSPRPSTHLPFKGCSGIRSVDACVSNALPLPPGSSSFLVRDAFVLLAVCTPDAIRRSSYSFS